jgi:hypothetical protein
METIEDTEEPKVVQNSDYLYKSDVKWRDDIEYIEPSDFEKDLLKDTMTPAQLLEEEVKEEVKQLTDEEIKKNIIMMIKVIGLDRMGLFPLMNPSYLQPSRKKELIGHMQSLVNEYNCGNQLDIANEFNRICNNKLLSNSCDVSTYPVYKNV